jgi:hypothetical protein
MARSGVGRDGEHHNDNASDATRDFLGDRGCIHSLRLHPHAQTNEEATNLTRVEADLRIAMLTAKLKLLDGPPHTLDLRDEF